jgi:DNA modification methylase
MIANVQIHTGHVLEVLAGMAEKSVHCCITSPPYW